MPITANAKGLSALSGFGLILASIVLAYLNATTSNPFWSLIYCAGIVVTALAAAAKWAASLGVEGGFQKFADGVSSIVPIVALYFVGIQALHFHHDGLDGFFAGISILDLVFLVAFGVADAAVTWLGEKSKQASTAMHDLQDRVHRAQTEFGKGSEL